MTLGRQDLLVAAQAAEMRTTRRTGRPLLRARLWDRPSPRTSQLRAAWKLKPVAAVMTLLGGNRTGKTELGAMFTVAMALGGDHPDVIAWCRANRIPNFIPHGPGVCCASALTGGDSLRYQRPKLDKYLPAGSVWNNRFGKDEAFVRLPNGGIIWCKSNNQGAGSYQGDSWRFFWPDEEHDEDVFNEALLRLLDQGGRCLHTMTPLKGVTWVKRRFIDKPDEGFVVEWLHMEDNPHLHPDLVRLAIARMSDRLKEARTKGLFITTEGLIYTTWDPSVHLVDPFDVFTRWADEEGEPLFWRLIDWGGRAPHCTWLVEDPGGEYAWAFREHAPRRGTDEPSITKEAFIQACMDIEADDMPLLHGRHVQTMSAADSADPFAINTAAGMGWWVDAVTKGPGSLTAGIDLFEGYLLHGEEYPDGPRFRVFRGRCPQLVDGLEDYKWADPKPGMEPTPAKGQNDHGPDTVRYWAMRRAALGMR